MHLWPEGSSKAQFTIVNDIIKQYEKDHPDVKIQTEILGNEQYKDKIEQFYEKFCSLETGEASKFIGNYIYDQSRLED